MLEKPRVGPCTKKKGKIMKVQALKDLVLSILWAEACVSIWVFLHSGIWEEIV